MANARGPTKSALLYKEFNDGSIIELIYDQKHANYPIFMIRPQGRRHEVSKVIYEDGWINDPSGVMDLDKTVDALTGIFSMEKGPSFASEVKQFLDDCIMTVELHSVMSA